MLDSDEEYKRHGKPSDKYRAKKRQKIRSELDKWIEDGVQQEDENIEDPLAWWLNHEKSYPILSQMALDLFSIPAMSSGCERVFSQAKKLITDEHSRLSAATIEADECLKNWLRNGLVQ